MNEYPELAADPAGRIYEEMRAALDPKISYPVQVCPLCGWSHVDFEYLKNCPNPCPHCGGI